MHNVKIPKFNIMHDLKSRYIHNFKNCMLEDIRPDVWFLFSKGNFYSLDLTIIFWTQGMRLTAQSVTMLMSRTLLPLNRAES